MSLASDVASVLESLSYGTWGGGTTPGATIFVQHVYSVGMRNLL
jgi:hypothetical protein